MQFRVIAPDTYKRAAWKNGLGFTSEIAIYPEAASLKQGNFTWRLSSAEIHKASAFSEFPFHDRTLVILKGDGIKLFHAFEPGEEPEVVDVPPLQPYEFPGDVPSRCELSSGPVTDLSVFARKGETEVAVEVVDLAGGEELAWTPGGRWNFLFAVTEGFTVTLASETVAVQRGDTFELTLDAPLADGEAIVIQAHGGDASIVDVRITG